MFILTQTDCIILIIASVMRRAIICLKPSHRHCRVNSVRIKRIVSAVMNLLCLLSESEKQIEDDIEIIKNDIEKQGYSISYGVSFSEVSTNAERFIKQAERNMLDNKYSYYHKRA